MSDTLDEETTTSTDYRESLPKVLIRDEDSIWQYKYVNAKFNTCFNSGECTHKRILMPENYVNEEHIIDDYDYTPAVLATNP